MTWSSFPTAGVRRSSQPATSWFTPWFTPQMPCHRSLGRGQKRTVRAPIEDAKTEVIARVVETGFRGRASRESTSAVTKTTDGLQSSRDDRRATV